MVSGPTLSDTQVFERIVGMFQTYDSSGASVLTRTAFVLEQRDPRLILHGDTPEYLVWLVAADSRTGNTYETRGFDSRADAEGASIEWVGEPRRVTWEQVSPSALTVMMSQIQRIAWR